MVIWLVLWITLAPIHVGNFPNMQSCMEAARTNESIVTHRRSQNSLSVGLICVQANTGKPNDPPPPP